MRCTEGGGEVVITTSIPSSLTIRIAAGIAVRFQLTFSSGTSSRRPAKLGLAATRSRPVVPCSSSAGCRPFGPTYRTRCTQASVGGGSSSSRWIHFGSSGASTCVSIPSSGRWVANFSGRCTPPPPAGGK